MSRTRAIAVYVSGHGFGHAVRVSEILRCLLRRNPSIEVHVRTSAPTRLFPRSPGRLFVCHASIDVGMVQPHSLQIDFEATLQRLDELDRDWDRRSADEATWLKTSRARLVLGDIPPLAFDVARRAAVPALALGNFSWDWVYGSYAERDRRFLRHAERAADAYRKARCLLRLPFHPQASPFASIVDLPIVARRFAWPRNEARRLLGLPADRAIVLMSFGGLGYSGVEVRAIGEMADILFVSTEHFVDPPPNLVERAPADLDYALLLAASDAVLTKPGYGIVASSLVNGLRLLCVEREDFPESSLLLRALAEHGTAASISLDDLARGRFRAPLDALLSRPASPAPLDADGAEEAARLLDGELAA
jgi:L-arabinokinase